MKRFLLPFLSLAFGITAKAQNLVYNPGAEILPRGTGWTIISQGPAPCEFVPTDNYINWTLIPDGTVNYPYDHTTGAPGGIIFYAGCSDFFGGPFELQQTIDVSADAATIDLGTQLYTFSGYMQTPVSNQTDQGRFIVDYLDASNAILGTSYTTAWQSFFGGSGAGWNFYTNTRLAPASTRKIRIRLQAQIIFNRYAVNVYFDDISLTRPTLVPVRLLTFTAHEQNGNVLLNWKVEAETNLDRYELEQSTDGVHFSAIGSQQAGNLNYSYTDVVRNINADKFFYRLKMIDRDGRISYSHIVPVSLKTSPIRISPNPASDWVNITGVSSKGTVSIINTDGRSVINRSVNAGSTSISISQLPAGIYFLRYTDGSKSFVQKLMVGK